MKNKFAVAAIKAFAGIALTNTAFMVFIGDTVAEAAPTTAFNSAVNENGAAKATAVDWSKDGLYYSRDKLHRPICYRMIYPGDKPPDANTNKYPPYVQDGQLFLPRGAFLINCSQFGKGL